MSTRNAVDKRKTRYVEERIDVPYGNGGYLELSWCNRIDDTAVLAGWVSHDPDLAAWLEHEDGRRFPLERAFRFSRQDLIESNHPALGRVGGVNAAFLVSVPEVQEGDLLRLILTNQDGQSMLLSEVAATPLPRDPLTAFRQSMGLATPRGRLTERFSKVDWPVLTAMLEQQSSRWARLETQMRDIGPVNEEPKVSIIIPLYRRFDFVEPQLMKFSQDAWLRENAQVIYVIDDPTLVDTMRTEATTLYDLYRVPFRWVWGQTNRGYSGANNLGASVATAQRLLFLNSDVFPMAPGWIEPMLEVLEQRADLGAVAPMLLHADGTVQHAGMQFRFMDELGIWTNYHPGRGIEPGLLAQPTGLVEMPAVTGACLLVRRKDLKAVGGWDTGYMVGDFEDSDLCLSLRAKGLGSACLMDVKLTHLERQSFASLGDPGFRTGVVILNATRHQNRWNKEIEELART